MSSSSVNPSNSTQSFTTGKITFRLGSIFDEEILNECDAIVLPSSDNGSADFGILKGAETLDFGTPIPGSAGSVNILDLPGKRRPFIGVWAYTVVAGAGSTIDIIASICNAIISNLSSSNANSVNLPLLGTGAGGLKPSQVIQQYIDSLGAVTNRLSFVVSIVEYDLFQSMLHKFEGEGFNTLNKAGADIQSQPEPAQVNVSSSKGSPENPTITPRDVKATTKTKATQRKTKADNDANKIADNNANKINEPAIKSRLHSDSFNLNEPDVLNYDLIANNLFTILTNEDTNPPLNIGILAPWGRGKTSLMRRLQHTFDECRHELAKKGTVKNDVTQKAPDLWVLRNWLKENGIGVKHSIPYTTVWFNPWNYQSSDMIWAGLADAVIEQVVEQIPNKIDREIFWMQLRLARIDKDEIRKDLQTRVVLFFSQFVIWGIVLAGLAACFWLRSSAITALAITIPGFILGLITSFASVIKSMGKTISEAFDKYTRSPKYVEKLGTFHEVQADLNRVLDLCVDEKKPLVIFVDDLDRCSPSKVVEVIEAINVFINGKYNNKCYFIMGMDAEMVAAALDVAYEKMKGKMGSKETEQGSVGWYFLDKFIQLPFFIPVMSELKKEKYLESLLTENNTAETHSEKVDVIKVEKVYHEVMSTTDIAKSSAAISQSALTSGEKKELDKMILKKQVQSADQNEEIKKQMGLYAKFISSDPRSLKRFANLLRFYCSYQFLRMKKGEPFVEAKTLAKWLALMLKFPQLVRWIQLDADNKPGLHTSEDKAAMMDDLTRRFIKEFPGKDNALYDNWLRYEVPKELLQGVADTKIGDFSEMPWLKSQNMFKILMSEFSDDAKFKNALNCNVW